MSKTETPVRPRRTYWLAYPLYLVVQAAVLLVIRVASPRQFWLDDSQAQFLPTNWWMGQLGRTGSPVLVDPELGMAGNFTVDMQYGALDPLHWLLSAWAGSTHDLLMITWGFAALTLFVLGSGLFVLLAHHRAHVALVISAAAGVGSTGFLLWYASTWWPILWSICWVPWLWWALASRSRLSIPVAFLSTWAIFAAGNPYLFPFAALLMIVSLLAAVRLDGGWAAFWRSGRNIGSVVAVIGGALVAAPTLLTALQLAPYMAREAPEPNIGNSGFAVPNLFDFLLSGTTSLAASNWGAFVAWAPALALAVFVLPLLAMVEWRTAIQLPQTWVPLGLVVASALLSQLPTVLAIFRYPLRYAQVYHLALVVLAIVAFTVAPRVTRGRIVLAVALVALQCYLAFVRAPVLWRWNAVGAAIAVMALTAIVVLVMSRRRLLTVTSGILLVGLTCAAGPLQILEMKSLQNRLVTTGAETPDAVGTVHRVIPDGRDWGTTSGEIERSVAVPNGVVTVINTLGFGDPASRGLETGILIGNGGLFGGMRTGVGYAAAPQRYLNEAVASDLWGKIYSPGASTWLEVVPGTNTRFIDLYASDVLVLQGDGLEEVRAHLDESPLWVQGESVGPASLLTYRRVTPLVSRVTLAEGVEVSSEGGTAGYSRLWGDEPEESFRVSTGPVPGRVVLRVPYWPGYTATVGGEPVEVEAVADMLVAVAVPAGVSDATVEVRYQPMGARLFVPLVAAGGVLLLAGIAISFLRLRRPESNGA